MSRGGARPGAGRKPTGPNPRLNLVVTPAVFAELKRREQLTGVYRTKIAALALETLIGGVVQH
jgi:hypothetical protein